MTWVKVKPISEQISSNAYSQKTYRCTEYCAGAEKNSEKYMTWFLPQTFHY